MGRIFKTYIQEPGTIYCCSHCNTHVATKQDVVSKSFHGKSGRAFLFNKGMNVEDGKTEERYLLSGLHRVCDITCADCGHVLGWKYLYAFEDGQKYKEGKIILERALVTKMDNEP